MRYRSCDSIPWSPFLVAGPRFLASAPPRWCAAETAGLGCANEPSLHCLAQHRALGCLQRPLQYALCNVSFTALALLHSNDEIETSACLQSSRALTLAIPVTVQLRGRAGARCMVSFSSRLTRPTHDGQDRETTSKPKPVRSTAALCQELRRGVPVRGRIERKLRYVQEAPERVCAARSFTQGSALSSAQFVRSTKSVAR